MAVVGALFSLKDVNNADRNSKNQMFYERHPIKTSNQRKGLVGDFRRKCKR